MAGVAATHNGTMVETWTHGQLLQVRIGQTPGRVCHAHSAWWMDAERAVKDFEASLAHEEKRARKALQEIADARVALAKLMEVGDATDA